MLSHIEKYVKVKVHLLNEMSGCVLDTAVIAYLHLFNPEAAVGIIRVKVLDNKLVTLKPVFLHVHQRSEHNVVAVRLHDDLHTVLSDNRHKFHQCGLSGGMNMGLRVLYNHKATRFGHQESDDYRQGI